jgi:hypothetical protein
MDLRGDFARVVAARGNQGRRARCELCPDNSLLGLSRGGGVGGCIQAHRGSMARPEILAS